MKLNSSAYMVTYVSVMGAAVAVLLTGVGRFTAPRKTANEEGEKLRNILQVFRVPVDSCKGAEDLKALFEKNVRTEQADKATRYLYAPEGVAEPKAVAVSFEGSGLWGPIKGFLALEPDMETIIGLTIYQQEETPGLGGEIATEAFSSRFVGKKISSPEGKPGLFIRTPGKASGINEVDAITGATMTCKKVESMLNVTIADLKEKE